MWTSAPRACGEGRTARSSRRCTSSSHRRVTSRSASVPRSDVGEWPSRSATQRRSRCSCHARGVSRRSPHCTAGSRKAGRGEWFRPTPELLGLIERLRATRMRRPLTVADLLDDRLLRRPHEQRTRLRAKIACDCCFEVTAVCAKTLLCAACPTCGSLVRHRGETGRDEEGPGGTGRRRRGQHEQEEPRRPP